jgi:hypothetical protein
MKMKDGNLSIKNLYNVAKHIGIENVREYNRQDLLSTLQILNYIKYRTIDSGGVPFEVYINEEQVIVFPLIWDYDLNIGHYDYKNPVLKIKNYNKLWTGKDENEQWHENYDFENGNAILVRKDDTYYFIGDRVYSFELENDTITRFGCPTENGTVVVYAYAIGEKFTYDLSNDCPQHIEPFLQVKGELKIKIIANKM